MRILFSIYLILQGAFGVAWWILMLKNPNAGDWITFGANYHDQMIAFLIADLLIFVDGSILSGVLLLSKRRGAVPVLFVTAGGLGYSALTSLNTSLLTGSGWMATSLLMSAMLITVIIALEVPRMFTTSTQGKSQTIDLNSFAGHRRAQ